MCLCHHFYQWCIYLGKRGSVMEEYLLISLFKTKPAFLLACCPKTRGIVGRERMGTGFSHFFHSKLTWRRAVLLRFPVCSSPTGCMCGKHNVFICSVMKVNSSLFKNRRNRYIGLVCFSHNLPFNKAHKVFKPSTDSASLLVPIKTKLFDLGVEFSLDDVTKRACFWIFDQLWLALDANPICHFLAQFFWKLGDIHIFRALDWPSSMSETKIIAHKLHFPQTSKIAEKAWVSH